MKFIVFDAEIEAHNLWLSNISHEDIEFQEHWQSDQIQQLANLEPSIIVLDQSVVADLPISIANCCSRLHHHLFIASGSQLTVPLTAQTMKLGATWVMAKPLHRQQLQVELPMIRRTFELLNSQLIEFRQLLHGFNLLSSRERDVLDRIMKGVANRNVAEELSVSTRTVEARRSKIYQKLDTKNVVQLVRKVDRLETLRNRFATKIAEGHGSGLHHHLWRRFGMDSMSQSLASDGH